MIDTLPAPAPWQLRGQGYVLAVWLPEAVLDHDSFLPAELQPTRRGRLAYVAFVDYQESDVGPYHELLFIPGTLDFGGERHYSISKIYVSSQASVDNGRRNWGIPKELADFDVEYGAGVDHIRLRTPEGDTIAELAFSHHLLPLPVDTAWAPRWLLTLGQLWEGRQYFYRPDARGHIKPARLTGSRFDRRYFPDLSQGRVLGCVKVTDFTMLFPIARIEDARNTAG